MRLICLPVTVQLVALEDFCPAFLQFVLRQLLWFFFVNLRNGISTSCKQEMLLQCLRLFSSYTQKIKAPLCDWKGHVVNLPIWTWVLFLNTCSIRIPTVTCRHVATTLSVHFWFWRGGAMHWKPGSLLVISGQRKKKYA